MTSENSDVVVRQMFKVLTLVYSIGPGGTERAAVNYAVAYRRAGLDSRMWVLGSDLHRKKKLEDNGVHLYIDEANGNEYNSNAIAEWKPDIVHIHNFNMHLYQAFNPLKQLGARIIETNVFSRPSLEKQYSSVDVSFQLAYWGFWKYHNWTRGMDKAPLPLVMPYPVECEDFTETYENERTKFRMELNLPEDAFVAGRVGQAHYSKWDKRIFDVVKSTVTSQEKIYFVFVGLPETLKQEYNSLPEEVKQQIRLIEFLSGDKALTRFYKSIDIFVHISAIGESFGYVLVEAMVCGCPVITLSTPLKDNAQFEVVGHKIRGYCAISISDFTKALSNFYKGQLSFNTNAFYDAIDAKFSPRVLVNTLVSYFSTICSGNNYILMQKSQEMLDKSNKIVSDQLRLYEMWRTINTMLLNLLHRPTVFWLLKKLRN